MTVGWAIDGTNRNDIRMLGATLDAVANARLVTDIDNAASRPRL